MARTWRETLREHREAFRDAQWRRPSTWPVLQVAFIVVVLFVIATTVDDFFYYIPDTTRPDHIRFGAPVGFVFVALTFFVAVFSTWPAVWLACISMGFAVWTNQGPFALLPAMTMAFVVMLRAQYRAGLVCLAGLAVFVVAFGLRKPDLVGPLAYLLGGFIMLTGGLGWVLRSTRRGRDVAEERARSLELEVSKVRERERRQLARELHDVVAHGLTLISMQATVMRISQDPGQVETARAAIERSSRDSLEELKRLLHVLRASEAVTDEPRRVNELDLPVSGADGEQSGAELTALAERLATELRAVGHSVTVDCAVGPVPRSVLLAADRVLREATTNIIKHAGKGTGVHITVRGADTQLVIDVDNELRSERITELGSSHLGVVGLTERVELLGGTLTAGQEADHWRVRATLPLAG